MNNKARHNLTDAKCRWCSNRPNGAGSFWEPLGQTQVMQIHQWETLNHQGVITHDFCCVSCQLCFFFFQVQSSFIFACNAVLAAIHSFRYPIIKLFFGVQEGGNNWQSSTREYRPVSSAMVARSVSMIFIAKRPWASFSWHFPPFEDPCHWSAVWPSTR